MKKMLDNVNTRRLIGVFVFSAIALGLLLLVVIKDKNKTL